jgi:hypothetical protein
MGVTPKTIRRETSVAQRLACWTWHKAGKTNTQISRLEGLPRTTVASIIQRVKATNHDNTFKSSFQCGAPKKLTIRAERALIWAAVANCRAPLITLCTPSKSRKQVCKTIVRKVFKKHNKGRRKPRKKPFLKPAHKTS